MVKQLFVALAASVTLACVPAIDRPPESPAPRAPETHHLAWWLGVQATRASFGVAPSMSVRCPDAASEAPIGSETWWKDVVAGLAACERAGVLAPYDIVLHVHLHEEPSPALRRYVGDIARTIEHALDAEAVDAAVRAHYAITPERPVTHRVTIDLALEPTE